jgi:hypothetical protein
MMDDYIQSGGRTSTGAFKLGPTEVATGLKVNAPARNSGSKPGTGASSSRTGSRRTKLAAGSSKSRKGSNRTRLKAGKRSTNFSKGLSRLKA